MRVGETLQLSVKIEPSDATNTIVFWESSDTSKLIVDDKGLVKAVAMPGAEITVITKDGKFENTIIISVVPENSNILNNTNNSCNTCDPCNPCNQCNTGNQCNTCDPCNTCNPCNECDPCTPVNPATHVTRIIPVTPVTRVTRMTRATNVIPEISVIPVNPSHVIPVTLMEIATTPVHVNPIHVIHKI